jgi:hypothetical protein
MTLQGEWWLQDGTAVFADSDVGDINHEHLVIQHCVEHVLDCFEASGNEVLRALISGIRYFIEADGVDVVAIRTYINDESDSMQKNGDISMTVADDIYDYMLKESKADEQQFKIAMDEGYPDSRLYGVQHLGWIRVQQSNVEVWEINKTTLIQAANGLYDAYGEDAELATYQVNDRKEDRLYSDVPYVVLANANMGWFFSNRVGT